LFARALGAGAVIVLVLFGLAALQRFVVRRQLSFGSARRVVSILETTMLAHGSSIHVVCVTGERLLVIGSSSGGVEVLCEIPPERLRAWREQALLKRSTLVRKSTLRSGRSPQM